MYLSIGICAYNEEKNIEHLLHQILYHQDLPDKTEILIVCSGCTDKTIQVVQNYSFKDNRIKYHVETERVGKASAVNKILKKAQGNFLLFVSADTLPEKGCFSSLISRLSEKGVGVVCGRPVPINFSNSFVTKTMKVLWLFHDKVFRVLNDSGIARHASEVFAIRRGIVDSLPLETINDDAFIAVTAKNKNWLIKYEPKAIVFISVPETLKEYFRQRRRIIYGHYQIKKLTGTCPQYLLHLLPYYPKKTIQLAFSLFKSSGFFNFLVFIWIEFVLNGLAHFDRLIGKDYSLWTPCDSTKDLVSMKL